MKKLTFNWIASCKWISSKALFADTYWAVIDYITVSVFSACVFAWVNALLIHTS